MAEGNAGRMNNFSPRMVQFTNPTAPKLDMAPKIDNTITLAHPEDSETANSEEDRENSLTGALRFYNDGEWEKARVEIAQHCRMYPNDKTGKHYLGLVLFQQGEYAKAASFFSQLMNDASFEQHDMATWYLAQAYTQFHTPQAMEDAQTLMQQLADDPDSGYSKQAKEYIRQILLGKDDQ